MNYGYPDDSLLGWFKIGFVDTTNRTYPIVRNIFKWSTWSNIAIGVSFKRIVDVAANGTFIFFHL